jgi:hypothetical protein
MPSENAAPSSSAPAGLAPQLDRLSRRRRAVHHVACHDRVHRRPRPLLRRSQGHTLDIIVLVLLVAAAIHAFLCARRPSRRSGWASCRQPPRDSLLGSGFSSTSSPPTSSPRGRSAPTCRTTEIPGAPAPVPSLTLLLLAVPSILILLLGRRAQTLLPKVRDWMSTNSWIVNEIVIAFFIGVTANSLAG